MFIFRGTPQVEDIVFVLTTYKKAMEQGVGDEKIWKMIKEE